MQSKSILETRLKTWGFVSADSMPGKLLRLEERKKARTLPMPSWLLRHRCLLPLRPSRDAWKCGAELNVE